MDTKKDNIILSSKGIMDLNYLSHLGATNLDKLLNLLKRRDDIEMSRCSWSNMNEFNLDDFKSIRVVKSRYGYKHTDYKNHRYETHIKKIIDVLKANNIAVEFISEKEHLLGDIDAYLINDGILPVIVIYDIMDKRKELIKILLSFDFMLGLGITGIFKYEKHFWNDIVFRLSNGLWRFGNEVMDAMKTQNKVDYFLKNYNGILSKTIKS